MDDITVIPECPHCASQDIEEFREGEWVRSRCDEVCSTADIVWIEADE